MIARPSVADVCLLMEGSYPYVAGGVSTWTHDLIKAHPDLTFHVVALVADRGARKLAYELPANVNGMTHVYLQEPDPGRGWVRDAAGLMRRLEAPLKHLQQGGGLPEVTEILTLLAPLRPKIGRRVLLNSEEAFHLVTRLCRETLPDASFLEYFWGMRALMGGMYATMLTPMPPARVYHAVSTGYAGLFATRARLESGRPAILTEHGIYTNERRIEILMAEWLFEGGDSSLAVERKKRDLRDLWLDTFASYSKACYDACDAIVTLYGGNQVFQLRQGADPAKLRIIPNGIDYAGYSKVVRQDGERPPTIALIGRVVPIKDVKTFIRAAGILREEIPDLQAMILGPTEEDQGYVEECRSIVAHLGLERTVIFAGRVKLTDWLGRVDAIALTSVSEAQPLVILEAGASGVPTVATDVGSCSELILGRPDEDPPLGPGGAITPLASPLATARELRALLLDAPWRERCAAAIRERVRRYYDKVEIDRIYRALYNEHIDKPDRPVTVGKAA
ncbi:GT4 family glycosyltransferase PelF [Azospirillum sp. RWY-5-1]|uniref:GT4 family glycosyltransferase PelF n=1 Tax=Azospirillum oleiclasticum TaxID=2735135 RepID=A0ABX2T2Q6_9PROT|nr:GT4 family glycosyltransferase PelF [Azospirillum oleiclasticum]NYZ10953.1 GT4 family glycosyltransferase PelF [Azospirillum oleiclasticum]NYZ18115.1 GT4 family glycosyltransferase PelF [Azospirillum oleiclasticum]